MKSRKTAPTKHSHSNTSTYKSANGAFLHFLNRFPKWVLITILALIIIRAFLPVVGKWVINHQLDQKMGAYYGHVDDFGLSLYRGAYQLQGLTISKRGAKHLPPIWNVDQIDIAISWKSLTHKMVTTNIKMQNPEVNLVDSKNEKEKQFGQEETLGTWSDVFDTIFPIKIENIKIDNGAIYFSNNDVKSPLMLTLEKMNMNVRDLRTRERDLLSPFSFEALLQGHAKVIAEGSMDILSVPPKLDMDFQFEKFHLSSINKLMLMYIPIDITRGDLSAYGEFASEGNAVGYMKVFLKSGDIIDPKQEYKGPKHFFLEILAGLGTWFLENNKTHNVAVEIPFHYRNGQLDVSTTKAFWSALKNANDRLSHQIDNKISLKNLGKEPTTEQTKNLSVVDKKVPDMPIKGQKPSKTKPTKKTQK